MPQPWTTSASASIGGPTASSRSSRARRSASRAARVRSIPTHPQGLFFRDTRFISELRLHAQRDRARAARRDHAPIRSARVFVLRGHPVARPRRLAPRAVPAALHRARDARRPRDRELRRGSRVLLGRDRGRRRLRRPVRGQGRPGPQAGQARRAQRRHGAHHVHLRAQLVRARDARRLHRRAAHLRLARALRGDRAAARAAGRRACR